MENGDQEVYKEKEKSKEDYELEEKEKKLNDLIENAEEAEYKTYPNSYQEVLDQEQKMKRNEQMSRLAPHEVLREQVSAHLGYTRRGKLGAKIDALEMKRMNDKVKRRKSLIKNLERLKKQKIQEMKMGKLNLKGKKTLDELTEKIARYKSEVGELETKKGQIKENKMYHYALAKTVGVKPNIKNVKRVRRVNKTPRRRKSDEFTAILKKLKNIEANNEAMKEYQIKQKTPEIQAQNEYERVNAVNEQKLNNAYGVEDWILKI